MNKKFRAFFAWMLPEPLQTEIKPLLKELKEEFQSTDTAFTALNKLHLTLRFLGNISETESLQLVTATEKALKDQSSFPLRLTNIDFFPSQQSKKALVIACSLNSALINLVNVLEQVVQSFGFPPETRPFQPHGTLARLRRGSSHKDIIETQFSRPMDGMLQEISLMRSDFTKEGTIYSPVWKKKLRLMA